MEKAPSPIRKSNDAEQMALARIFDGSNAGMAGGEPIDLVAHALYAPFAGGDALQALVSKNVFADFGEHGYARGWKWDSYVNSGFTKDEKPPLPVK